MDPCGTPWFVNQNYNEVYAQILFITTEITGDPTVNFTSETVGEQFVK